MITTGKPVQADKKGRDGTINRVPATSGEDLGNKKSKNMTIHRYANPTMKTWATGSMGVQTELEVEVYIS